MLNIHVSVSKLWQLSTQMSASALLQHLLDSSPEHLLDSSLEHLLPDCPCT